MIALRGDIPRLAGRVATQPRAAAEPSQLSGTPATHPRNGPRAASAPAQTEPGETGNAPQPLGSSRTGDAGMGTNELQSPQHGPLCWWGCTGPAWTTQAPAAQRSPSVTPSPGLPRWPLGWVGTGKAVASAAAMQEGSRCQALQGCTLEFCWEQREL